ncbi:nitroreductase family protein [bacterium]|nr:nitroreductase family protein [bacterium]
MNTLKCIKTRRSIRKFLDTKISDEDINCLITSAQYAPYSKGKFSCEFIIIKNNNTKKELSAVRDNINEQALTTAPVLIVICIDKNSTPRWIESTVFCAENILLSAHDINLGAVYTVAYNRDKPEITKQFQKILNLPSNIIPVCIIPIGHPDKSKIIADKIIADKNKIIHLEKW